jgi:hypothetical protein
MDGSADGLAAAWNKAVQALAGSASTGSAGSDLSVAYDDGRHGYCVYEQHRRGEYRVVAGPFIDAADAHDAMQNKAIERKDGGQ